MFLCTDDDGLPIKEDKGRFFEVVLQAPKGFEVTKNTVFREGLFVAEFSSVELSEVGEYSVYIQKVFDLSVKPTARTLSLPTKSHCIQFQVVSSGLKRVVGGLIGGVMHMSTTHAQAHMHTRLPTSLPLTDLGLFPYTSPICRTRWGFPLICGILCAQKQRKSLAGHNSLQPSLPYL